MREDLLQKSQPPPCSHVAWMRSKEKKRNKNRTRRRAGRKDIFPLRSWYHLSFDSLQFVAVIPHDFSHCVSSSIRTSLGFIGNRHLPSGNIIFWEASSLSRPVVRWQRVILSSESTGLILLRPDSNDYERENFYRVLIQRNQDDE